MKLAKSKVFVFISLMLLSALIVLTTILALPSTNLNAEVYLANTFSDKISVKAFNDEGSEQTTSPASITLVSPDGTSTPNYTSYSYNWSNIEYFEITLDTSSLPDAKEYNYNFTVTWIPSYITNSTANIAPALFYTFSRENKAQTYSRRTCNGMPNGKITDIYAPSSAENDGPDHAGPSFSAYFLQFNFYNSIQRCRRS